MVPAHGFQDAQLLFHAGSVMGVIFTMHSMEQLKITNERLFNKNLIGGLNLFTHLLLPDLSKVPTIPN